MSRAADLLLGTAIAAGLRYNFVSKTFATCTKKHIREKISLLPLVVDRFVESECRLLE